LTSLTVVESRVLMDALQVGQAAAAQTEGHVLSARPALRSLGPSDDAQGSKVRGDTAEYTGFMDKLTHVFG
jgi:hypothetical protein